MPVASITSYNSTIKYNKNTSLPVSKISFGNKASKTPVEQWCNLFEAAICDKAPENVKQERIDSLLKILESESLADKTKILLDKNFNVGNIFEATLCYNSYAAKKVWEFIKEKTNADIQGRFLMGDVGAPNDTAMFNAANANELELAEDILNFVDTKLDVRLRQRFFNLKFDGKTQYHCLLDRGYLGFADKFNAIANKYKTQNTGNEEKHSRPVVSEKYGNSGNYRVYDNVKTRFSDVGGMFNVKNQIQNELLSILKNPKVKNSDKPSGIILFGPPGTGKSLLATAIAGEAGVPFVSTEGSSFAEVYVGAGPANVRKLYAEARALANSHPTKTAIVFIDEVDAVGGKRGASSNSERDNTLNALLSEMDGVKSKEENDIKIITMLATNRKDMLDSAFRKGRIDLEFKIDDPRCSEKARYEILSIHAKDKPFENDEEKNQILKNLAHTTAGFSGAELADVIKRAYRKTLYLGRNVDFITRDDINNAKLESLIGIKNDSEITEYEQKKTIAHEAGHAVNLVLMDRIFEQEETLSKRPIRVLDLIVNESRGDASGMTISKPSDFNIGRITIESLINNLVVTYGGYSVEETLFGCHTDGVSSDLESNTERIFNAVTRYGLGSKTKYLCVKPDGQVFEMYKNDIKKDIETYSQAAMKISNKLAKFTAPFIHEYTDKFFEEPVKIIKGADFIKMFDEWLKKNNKKDEFENLKNDILSQIDSVRKTIENG